MFMDGRGLADVFCTAALITCLFIVNVEGLSKTGTLSYFAMELSILERIIIYILSILFMPKRYQILLF
jgi:hypothetical protein